MDKPIKKQIQINSVSVYTFIVRNYKDGTMEKYITYYKIESDLHCLWVNI